MSAPSTVSVRPVPGAAFEDHDATAELAAWLDGLGPFRPVMVVLYGRLTSGQGTPVDVVVTGSTGADPRTVYGDAAEISADLLIARGSGVPVPLSGADLAVPLTLDDEDTQESGTHDEGEAA